MAALIVSKDTTGIGAQEAGGDGDLARERRDRRDRELLGREPPRRQRVSRSGRRASGGTGGVDGDVQTPVNDRVLRHNGDTARHNAETLRAKRAPQRGRRVRRRLAFGRRELPESVQQGGRALDEENAASPGHAGRRDEHRSSARRRAPAREQPRATEPPPRADGGEGTGAAAGLARGADELSQVHEGRRHAARVAAGDERRGDPSHGGRMRARPEHARDGEEAGERARYVRLDRGQAHSEGERSHGRRHVLAEPRKRPQLIRVAGQAPPVPSQDVARRPVEVARPRVVAQTRPGRQDRLLPGAGESGEVGKTGQEGIVAAADGSHRRLLEHDLRDPDAVRVARASPGKRTLLPAKPGEEDPADAGRPRR
jgi:hypothetical protein